MNNFISQCEEQIFSHPAITYIKSVDELLVKKTLTIEESLKLQELYFHAKTYYDSIKDLEYKNKQLINVVTTKDPLLKNHPTIQFLIKITTTPIIKNIYDLLVTEENFYSKNNIEEWQKTILERQKLVQELHNDIQKISKKTLSLLGVSKVEAFALIDAMIMKIFPKTLSYRDMGVSSGAFVYRHFMELLKDVSPNTKNFILTNYSRPEVKAYMMVMSQVSLINYDICTENYATHKYEVQKAAFRIGLDYFLIKIADNYFDDKTIPLDKRNELLELFLRAMMGKLSVEEMSKHPLLEFTNISQKRFINTTEREEALYLIKRTAQKGSFVSKLLRKVTYSKLLGKVCARLNLETMKNYVPVNEEFEDFILNSGITGQVFDDWKDYNIDNPDSKNAIIKRIFFGWRTITSGIKTVLPVKRKTRLMSFMILAGIFQLREILGIKERT